MLVKKWYNAGGNDMVVKFKIFIGEFSDFSQNIFNVNI